MIREAQEKDLEAILDLWLKGNLKAHAFLPSSFFTERMDLMRMILPATKIYVQDLNGVKGFIGISDSVIAGIYVDESMQNQGLGTSLLNHVKAICSELFVFVYPQNESALQFFKKQGFERQEEVINEETGLPEYVLTCQTTRQVHIGCCAL